MSTSDQQTRTDHTPMRSGVSRLFSVRRINIVLTLIILGLLIAYAGLIGRRIGFCRTGKVEIDGLTFYLNPKGGNLTDSLLSSGTYEPEQTDLFRRECHPGDTVVDVGANIGWYTVIASKLVGKNGHVIAFEPDPNNVETLKRNILANGCENVILEQKALSNAAGTITLYLDRHNNVEHSIVFDRKGEAIKVEALRLDDYLENRLKKADLVKIDVEGAEPLVLEGMSHLINSRPGIRLVVEFAPDRVIAVGRQPKQYLEDFVNQGFLLYLIDEPSRQVVQTSPDGLLDRFNRDPKLDYTNVFMRRGSK